MEEAEERTDTNNNDVTGDTKRQSAALLETFRYDTARITAFPVLSKILNCIGKNSKHSS